MTTDELKASWLHCNLCHRSFESHNQFRVTGERVSVVQSDLSFYFTSCGHFFCEHCIAGSSDFSLCKICGERSQACRIHASVPEKVAMYLRPPISLLEDSLSIMMFQLNNANKLIAALRQKISQQKDLLMRAKQELAGVRELKDRIKFLEGNSRKPQVGPPMEIQDPNETLPIPALPLRNGFNLNDSFSFQTRKPYQSQQMIGPRPTPSHSRSGLMIPPESPIIHTNGRLSLKSPSLHSVATAAIKPVAAYSKPRAVNRKSLYEK